TNTEPAPTPPPPVILLSPTPHHDHPPTLRLGPLGLTGVATLVGGAATIGAGALLISLPKLNYDIDPRRVGAALLIGGGVTTALGIAALAVDATVLERKRQRRRVHVSLDLSTTQAAVAMSGRF
ncbi:hypothetical protein, partial [Enhygromyxa salina]|uniref:hypothetical protein n=1 Tax=Enhygromyxa salina TaxID=215803 RepID=UPI0015E72F83